MDQGGESHENPEDHELFTEFHCDVKPTGAGASNQNGPVERGHLTVANAVRAMLIGGKLEGCWRTLVMHDRQTVFSDERMPDLGGS